MLKVWAKTQHLIALSSMEAELCAAVLGTSEAMGLQSVARDLGEDVQCSLGADSSAAVGRLQKEGLGKAKHVDTQWLWVQQQVRRKRLWIHKIPGTTNPADLMTKPLPAAAIAVHMEE